MILNARHHGSQRGMALITSLLLLLVVTILAVSMFRGFSVQGRIAGNVREKQRALTAAESAQQYAEWWLSQGSNAATATVACSTVLDANLNQGQICNDTLVHMGASVTTVPWNTGTGSIGVQYTPNLMLGHVNATAGPGTFYSRPVFNISDLGVSADAQGEVFQVDAAGWGANASSVAVVESTYEVTTGVVCRSCL